MVFPGLFRIIRCPEMLATWRWVSGGTYFNFSIRSKLSGRHYGTSIGRFGYEFFGTLAVRSSALRLAVASAADLNGLQLSVSMGGRHCFDLFALKSESAHVRCKCELVTFWQSICSRRGPSQITLQSTLKHRKYYEMIYDMSCEFRTYFGCEIYRNKKLR